jgi:zinc D-Ala-D-Ala dipeptidase
LSKGKNMKFSRNIIFVAVLLFVSNAIFAKLVDLSVVDTSIKLDIRYATKNNFVKTPVYSLAKCYLEKDVAIALKKVQKDLKKDGLGLKVWDGYRPRSVQYKFWEALSKKYPNEKEREKYVINPKNGSRHNSGTAADLTLIDLKTEKELEMPTKFDDFTPKAHRNYSLMSEVEKKNCKKLEDVMVKYGFVPLPTEWWHFDFHAWNDKKKNGDRQYPFLDISFEKLEKKRNIFSKMFFQCKNTFSKLYGFFKFT